MACDDTFRGIFERETYIRKVTESLSVRAPTRAGRARLERASERARGRRACMRAPARQARGGNLRGPAGMARARARHHGRGGAPTASPAATASSSTGCIMRLAKVVA